MTGTKGGRFITIEGGEGVGKSLFTANLARALTGMGRRLVTTREPGGTPVADHLRSLFASPPGGEALTMEAEALLVSAARSQHLTHKIRPAVAQGEWVLCDRFTDSTRVYQGALGGLAAADLEALILFSTRGTEPDVTLLLDCDVATAMARLKQRPVDAAGGVERYDQAKLSFHEQVRAAYLSLAERFPRRFARIDASRPPAAMVEQALHILEERFGRS